MPAIDRGGAAFLVPGILALSIISTSFVNLGISTAFERSYGVLKRLGGSPLSRSGLLVAKIATVLLVEVVQVVLVVGWRPSPSAGPWAPGADAVVCLAAFALGTLAFAGLAMLMAGTLRAEATLALANGLFLVLLLLGGVVLPLDHLPASAGRTWPRSCPPRPCPMPCGSASGRLRATHGGRSRCWRSGARPRPSWRSARSAGSDRTHRRGGAPAFRCADQPGDRAGERKNPGWSGPGVRTRVLVAGDGFEPPTFGL